MKDKEILINVEKAVKKANGKVAPADIASETGYALSDIHDALKRLIELFESKIAMNQNTGELQFVFAYPLVKRGSKSFSEQMYVVLEWLWKVFKVIYKASIAIILVVYTIIFALFLLVILFSGKSDDRDNRGGAVISGIFRAIFEALYFTSFRRRVEYQMDPSGLRFKKFEKEKNKGKGFIQSVYSFVFGPERPKYNPLDDDKEVIAFLMKNNYKLTAANIIELTGVNYDEADSRLASYLSKYDGEAHLNTDGVLTVDFPRLKNKVSKDLEGGKIIFYKDEVEAPYELTGNTTGKNTLIIFLNIFNFIMSIVAINIAMVDIQSTAVLIGLGIFPLIFSLLFFVIPLIRIPYIKKKQSEREQNIIRKKLFSVLFSILPAEIKENDFINYAQLNNEEISKAKNLIEKLIIDINGEINLNDRGEAVYYFDRLENEIKSQKG